MSFRVIEKFYWATERNWSHQRVRQTKISPPHPHRYQRAGQFRWQRRGGASGEGTEWRAGLGPTVAHNNTAHGRLQALQLLPTRINFTHTHQLYAHASQQTNDSALRKKLQKLQRVSPGHLETLERFWLARHLPTSHTNRKSCWKHLQMPRVRKQSGTKTKRSAVLQHEAAGLVRLQQVDVFPAAAFRRLKAKGTQSQEDGPGRPPAVLLPPGMWAGLPPSQPIPEPWIQSCNCSAVVAATEDWNCQNYK